MILPRSGINLTLIRWKRNIKAWPNDWVPFFWARPQRVPGYIDNVKQVPEPQGHDIRPEFRLSDKIRNLNEKDPARKMLSIEHALNHKAPKTYLSLIHEVDYPNSLEAKIYKLTYALKRVLEKIERSKQHPTFTGHIRTTANSIKNRRYRYLCELKELHRDRYEELRKQLNIEPTTNEINHQYVRPYRKIQMRLLAMEYAKELKEKKVDEFLESLEEEKMRFEEEKKATLEWIAEQEKKLGITV